jgi:hypothetical protein
MPSSPTLLTESMGTLASPRVGSQSTPSAHLLHTFFGPSSVFIASGFIGLPKVVLYRPLHTMTLPHALAENYLVTETNYDKSSNSTGSLCLRWARLTALIFSPFHAEPKQTY